MSYKKSYICYWCISIQERLDTETNEIQMNLDCFDKNIFKKCPHCHQFLIIKNFFYIVEDTCNV